MRNQQSAERSAVECCCQFVITFDDDVAMRDMEIPLMLNAFECNRSRFSCQICLSGSRHIDWEKPGILPGFDARDFACSLCGHTIEIFGETIVPVYRLASGPQETSPFPKSGSF